MKVESKSKHGHRAASRRGFTLVEVIVVVIILGVLAAVIAPRLIGRVGQSKHATAVSNAATLAGSVNLYANDTSRKLESGSLDFLFTKPSDVDASSWHGPYVSNPEMLKDPWGKPFRIEVPGTRNVDFDIVSYGRDGKAGGKDEDEDIRKP